MVKQHPYLTSLHKLSRSELVTFGFSHLCSLYKVCILVLTIGIDQYKSIVVMKLATNASQTCVNLLILKRIFIIRYTVSKHEIISHKYFLCYFCCECDLYNKLIGNCVCVNH